MNRKDIIKIIDEDFWNMKPARILTPMVKVWEHQEVFPSRSKLNIGLSLLMTIYLENRALVKQCLEATYSNWNIGLLSEPQMVAWSSYISFGSENHIQIAIF